MELNQAIQHHNMQYVYMSLETVGLFCAARRTEMEIEAKRKMTSCIVHFLALSRILVHPEFAKWVSPCQINRWSKSLCLRISLDFTQLVFGTFVKRQSIYMHICFVFCFFALLCM